jgi:ubiquitin carboxyl-terminal hydrolase 7
VAEECDWGFNKTVEIRRLSVVGEGKTRPLLENNTLMIKAYLRIMEDPTGVLWHSFDK